MPFNPFRASLFSMTASCLPCCQSGCIFTIPPPIGASPYADLTEATTVIAGQTASCIGYVNLDPGGLLTSFTATQAANEITLDVVGNPDNTPTCQAVVWFGGTFSAAGTITVTTTIGSFLASECDLYDSTGLLVDSNTGSPTTLSVPSAGVYEVRMSGTSNVAGFGGGSDTFSFDAVFDASMTICTIRAAYNDGGSTSYIVCV